MRKGTIPRISISLVLILILAQLSGCSRTIQELRKSDQTVVFAAKEPYQTVYNKIIEQARQCYQTGGFRGHTVVQGDLDSDLRKGVVTIAMIESTTASVRNDIIADIKAASDDYTVVTVYYDGKHRFIAENMAKWVRHDSTNCGDTEDTE